MRQFSNEISQLETALMYIEHTKAQKDKTFVLLNGLRAEFSMKKTILQEQDISFEETLSALEINENELANTQSSSSIQESVFIFGKPTMKCLVYRGSRHKYHDCWFSPKSKIEETIKNESATCWNS